MRIAPLSWNLCASGTVSSVANVFELGSPAANLFDADPFKVCRWRGLFAVSAGNSDKLYYTGSGVRTATLTATNYLSNAELCIHVAARINAEEAVGAQLAWLQGSTNRYRFGIYTSSSISLQIEGKSACVLTKLMGFRDADRSAATSHVGDFAAVGQRQSICLVDLASAKGAYCSIVANVMTSPGAMLSIARGTSSAVSNATDYFDTHYDDEVMTVWYSDPTPYRFVSLAVSDPRTELVPRIGLGYWYHGMFYDTDAAADFDAQDFEGPSYARAGEIHSVISPGIQGQPFISEIEPGEKFEVSFDASPGMGPSGLPAIEDLITTLGVNGLAFVALDPVNEPHRETCLARCVSLPSLGHMASQSKHGRWRVPLTFERIPTREVA